MKTYRPAPSRVIGSLLGVLTTTAALSALWIPFCRWLQMLARLEDRGRGSRLEEEIALYGILAAIVGLGLIGVLASLSRFRARYDIGATEIVLRHGLLWQSTRTIPLLEILRIEVSSGPVQRWLGYADLNLWTAAQPAFPVRLCGIAGADELRRFLVERQERLREATRTGDAGMGRTTGELLIERLAGAVERLERRLPARG
jgi:membrane protein YdbS with pleckstrin-like domain